MKNLFLLLGIVTIVFMSCSKNTNDLMPEANASRSNLKSASTGWVVFPNYPISTTTSGSYVTFTESLFQVNRDPSSGAEYASGTGQKQFAVSGGKRYKATLVLKDIFRAGVQISAP